MSEIVVYGVPGSPYLRSTLLALHEKGAPYRLALLGRDIAVRSEEQLMRGTSLDAWLKRMQARPSIQATEVDRLKHAA